MNPDAERFLNLATKPARVNVEQAAWLLGFMHHDLPVLVAKGLLKPIGDPPPNGVKYFATAELEQLKLDRKWLARATAAIHRHWKDKNHRKSPGARESQPSHPEPLPINPNHR